MHSIVLAALSGIALASAQVSEPTSGPTGQLGDAIVTADNPAGVTYIATLPDTTSIHGFVSATANGDGTGVLFNVYFTGLPSESLGPFIYHIHDRPVPSNGNCTGTLAHLDPFVRGEKPPCDRNNPQTCQVGDLSGKHGNVTTSPFNASYVDLYASTQPGLGSFLGNRSITFHSSNATRLTCANFTLINSNSTSSSNNSTGSSNTSTVSTSPTPTPSAFTGGAATTLMSIGAVVAGFVAFIL